MAPLTLFLVLVLVLFTGSTQVAGETCSSLDAPAAFDSGECSAYSVQISNGNVGWRGLLYSIKVFVIGPLGKGKGVYNLLLNCEGFATYTLILPWKFRRIFGSLCLVNNESLIGSGKAFTGYVSGSTDVITDDTHLISDVVLSGVALFSFKAARIPKDKEHPYGHS